MCINEKDAYSGETWQVAQLLKREMNENLERAWQ